MTIKIFQNALITQDDTDHFWFKCSECNCSMYADSLSTYPHPSIRGKSIVKIYLNCPMPDCGDSTTMKMELATE